MRLFRLLAFIAFAIALNDASLAQSSSIRQGKPIKIGAILHLTGDLAMQGAGFREGIELAADTLNKAGGVGGRSIQVIFEDSAFTPLQVHRAAKKLIDQDRVDAALISTFVETKSAGPLFEKAGIPLLCLWDSTPALDEMGDFLFSIGTWLPDTGKVSAKFAFEKLKTQKAAVVSTNREWSVTVGDDFSREFEKLGGSVVFKDVYNPGQADFRPLFLKIKRAGADVLYAPIDDNIGTFFKQLRQLQLDIPVIESDNLNDEWITNQPEDLEGVYQSQSSDPETLESLAMIKLYQQKHGKAPKQVLFQAWGYDGLRILAKAIEIEGGQSGQIQKGLYQITEFSGAIGKISIGAKGSFGLGIKMFQIQGGKFKRIDY